MTKKLEILNQKDINIKNNQPWIKNDINYNFDDSYYVKNRADIGIYKGILVWTDYASDWDEFCNKYPTFDIIGNFEAGIVIDKKRKGTNSGFITNETKKLGPLYIDKTTDDITANVEEIITYYDLDKTNIYTILKLQFFVYKEYIWLNWMAQFKGDITNYISVRLDTIQLFANIETK